MNKPVPHPKFGRLISQGIKQTAAARQETLQQTHQYLAEALNYGVTTLYTWRRGEHLPDDPNAVADLARLFVKTWDADERWIDEFLQAGEYGPAQAVEQLKQELFHKPAPESPAKAPGADPAPPQGDSGLTTTLLKWLGVASAKVIKRVPNWLDRTPGPARISKPEATLALFPATCGDQGIDLANQRLLVSSAFGNYFAGLLERDFSYVELEGQIEMSAASLQPGLAPLQQLYWALNYPKGPSLIVIAAEGGMGKSTLAARLVRCLFEENAVDMILGDSAKTQAIDPVSGAVLPLTPGYDNPDSFLKQLFRQLGLPEPAGPLDRRSALRQVRDRLEGRRAVIFMDNLENVAQGSSLFQAIQALVTRDTRVIVTTRTTVGLSSSTARVLLVHLKPLLRFEDVQRFLNWHIRTFAAEHPDLGRLEPDVASPAQVQRLLDRTGGIPLLIQLALSDIARFSWQYLDHLPNLLGQELLNFLYRKRWADLKTQGEAGSQARELLRYVNAEQYRGRKITFGQIKLWASQTRQPVPPEQSLRLLQERFLLVNYDLRQGSYAIFPSLAEFLNQQT